MIGKIAAISVTCKKCGKDFALNRGEILWYSKMGYPLPKRCPECRKTRNLRIAATLALNAVEEHLVGADIDWHDVARVLREALDERREDDAEEKEDAAAGNN